MSTADVLSQLRAVQAKFTAIKESGVDPALVYAISAMPTPELSSREWGVELAGRAERNRLDSECRELLANGVHMNRDHESLRRIYSKMPGGVDADVADAEAIFYCDTEAFQRIAEACRLAEQVMLSGGLYNVTLSADVASQLWTGSGGGHGRSSSQ